MKSVIIPVNAIEQFVQVARTNTDCNGKVVETLAYLIGVMENGNIRGTEILFPNQTGDFSKVVDNGRQIY
jgi:hypothetical protein